MRAIYVISSLLCLGAVVIGYQNCGEGFSAHPNFKVQSSDVGQQNIPPIDDPSVDPPVTPGPGNFKAGDNFDYDLVRTKSAFLARIIAGVPYSNYMGVKAVAIAPNGLGYASFSMELDQALVSQQAIESCNLLSSQACTLIAEGDRFIVDENNLDQEAAYNIQQAGSEFMPARMPGVGPSKQQMEAYKSADVNAKAIAISPSGFYSYFYPPNAQGFTQAEVERMVLQNCEMTAVLVPCFLWARGNQVVHSSANWMRTSRIPFEKTAVSDVVPIGAGDSALEILKTDYLEKLGTREGYVYIDGKGNVGFHIANNQNMARDEAKAKCEALADPNNVLNDSLCVPFAHKNMMTLTHAHTQAYQKQRALYCTIPRSSCDEHGRVGCRGQGSYWIMDGQGRPALQTCNLTQ